MSAPISRRGALVAAIAAIAAAGVAPVAASAATSSPSTGISALPAWPVLRRGSTGADVTTLQHLLTASGIATGADGAFGPGTESSVRTFQARKGLTADGIVGAQTWSALTGAFVLSEGHRGSAVKGLQVQLRRLGASIPADGIFGGMTASTVRFWQEYFGLVHDGIVGPQTWRTFIGR